MELVGPDGLWAGLTKNVLEASLEAEMSEHLGYAKHNQAGRTKGSSRNGTRAKTMLTEVGPVEVEVPRDRDGLLDDKIVKKRQTSPVGVDGMVILLTAQGLATGEVSAHVPIQATMVWRRAPSAGLGLAGSLDHSGPARRIWKHGC